MSGIKTTQLRVNIADSHLLWIEQMEKSGVSRASLINLALDVLRPKLDNIQTSDTAIVETLIMKTVAENLEF